MDTTFLDGRTSVPWVANVQQHAVPEAIEACAFMLLGDAKGIRSCSDAGRRSYVSGLRKVNTYLQDPSTMDIRTVLATVKILSLYEHMRRNDDEQPGTQAADWRQHIQGICHILQYRDSDLSIATGGGDLFENIHLNAITVNIMTRRHDLKLRERYRQLPHSLRGRLLVIMDEIPACFQEHDELLAQHQAGMDKSDVRERLVEQGRDAMFRIQSLMRRLQEWQQNALIDCYTKGGLSKRSATHLDDCCTEFGLGFLYTVSLYWTACLLTMSTMKTLSIMLERMLGSNTQSTALPMWIEARPYATKIAKHAKE